MHFSFPPLRTVTNATNAVWDAAKDRVSIAAGRPIRTGIFSLAELLARAAALFTGRTAICSVLCFQFLQICIPPSNETQI